MNKLTLNELREKYVSIEDKVPSIWKTYKDVGIELAQDLSDHWDITDFELYRVISLISGYSGISLIKHLDPKFSVMGLYPSTIKKINIEK